MPSHELWVAAGKLGAERRYGPPDSPRLAELRAELNRLRLTEAVEAALASAPPISPEMAIEIADLLVRGAAAAQRQAS